MEKYGHLEGCAGSKHERPGLGEARPHSAACRDIINKALDEDEEERGKRNKANQERFEADMRKDADMDKDQKHMKAEAEMKDTNQAASSREEFRQTEAEDIEGNANAGGPQKEDCNDDVEDEPG